MLNNIHEQLAILEMQNLVELMKTLSLVSQGKTYPIPETTVDRACECLVHHLHAWIDSSAMTDDMKSREKCLKEACIRSACYIMKRNLDAMGILIR